MKKLIPVLVIALAAAAFWFRGFILPPPPGQSDYLGYVEAETVLVGAPQAGRISQFPAAKGSRVEAGTLLFALDDQSARIDVSKAEAAVRTAELVRDNLLTGKRPAEIAAIAAQRDELEATLDLARKELRRASLLTTSGTAAQSRLDQAAMQVATSESRLAQLEANLTAASLPGREADIAAADARIAEAKLAAAAARQKLDDLSLKAPAAGLVDDAFFVPGEWVAAGQPVISILPDGGETLRFFVPETEIAKATPGTSIHFSCDGCGEGLAATITHTASTPEYTPPVIYSRESRAKLVFLVEAKPATPAGLRPGLPVTVAPLP